MRILDRDVLKSFESLAGLYRARLLEPALERHRETAHDPRGALALFVDYYAYERQGKSPNYAPAAVDAVMASTDLSPFDVWHEYVRLLGGQNLNIANNPLCPKGTPFVRKGISHQTWQLSIVEFVATREGHRNLLVWARDQLSAGCTRDAHAKLCGVNGIGAKIASLFLRDVATMNALKPDGDRHLLQPVDVWVSRLAALTCGRASFNTVDDCARAIVSASVAEDVSPERVNQGMWYFATQVCGSSEYVVERTIRERSIRQSIEDHVRQLTESSARAAGAWERLACR